MRGKGSSWVNVRRSGGEGTSLSSCRKGDPAVIPARKGTSEGQWGEGRSTGVSTRVGGGRGQASSCGLGAKTSSAHQAPFPCGKELGSCCRIVQAQADHQRMGAGEKEKGGRKPEGPTVV